MHYVLFQKLFCAWFQFLKKLKHDILLSHPCLFQNGLIDLNIKGPDLTRNTMLFCVLVAFRVSKLQTHFSQNAHFIGCNISS